MGVFPLFLETPMWSYRSYGWDGLEYEGKRNKHCITMCSIKMKPFKIHADFQVQRLVEAMFFRKIWGKHHVTGWNEARSEVSMSCSWFHSSISILISLARHIRCYLVTWNNELSIWSCERWFILQYSTKINKSELRKTWSHDMIIYHHITLTQMARKPEGYVPSIKHCILVSYLNGMICLGFQNTIWQYIYSLQDH